MRHCMRAFVSILSLTLIACNLNEKRTAIVIPNTKDTTILLSDSLGNISISVPNNFDTFFKWPPPPDDSRYFWMHKYRFQPKTFPIFKEVGYYYPQLKDSIFSFTIQHYKRSAYYFKSDTSYLFNYYYPSEKKDLLANPMTADANISDTIEFINGNYFAIFSVDLFDSLRKQYSKKLIATSAKNNSIIELHYELLTKLNDSINNYFLKDSRRLLSRIRF